MNSHKIAQDLPSSALRELEIREWTEDEAAAYRALLDKRHYLGAPDPRCCRLGQVVVHAGAVVALLTWNACSRSLAGRDQYIGWDARTRQKRLSYVVQNNRFLLLSDKRPLNLASRVLKLSIDHVAEAWERRYGKRPLLAETFVDPEGYKGTSYRAAGWQNLGRTAGFSRVSRDYYEDNDHPKILWVKPLQRDALELLRNPLNPLPAEASGPSARVPGVLPVPARVAESLAEALRKVPDARTRRGQQFPLGAMLATAVLALCTGARTVSDIFRFCQDLNASQRQKLGFRSNPQAPRVVPPPGEGCWRKVLKDVNPDDLARALNRWHQSQRGAVPRLLAIDGKVIGHNLATLVSLVDARDGTPVAQFAASGNGQEHALMKKLIDDIEPGMLEDKWVSGDALYGHKQLVRTVVHDHGGHVLMQLKANQLKALEAARRRFGQDAPPF